MTLTIGYIHPGTVRAEWSECLLGAMLDDRTARRRVISGLLGVPTSILPHGRNAMCHQFLQTDDTHLLMVDTDMTFTLEDVYSLFDSDKQIVSGLYLTRHGNPLPTWTNNDHAQMLEIEPGLQRIDSAGAGFLMIHRDVLEKMQAEHADDPWPWFGHDIIKGTRAGEDVTFCHRARQLGFEVWGHGGVHLGHIGTTTLHPTDHTEGD